MKITKTEANIEKYGFNPVERIGFPHENKVTIINPLFNQDNLYLVQNAGFTQSERISLCTFPTGMQNILIKRIPFIKKEENHFSKVKTVLLVYKVYSVLIKTNHTQKERRSSLCRSKRFLDRYVTN